MKTTSDRYFQITYATDELDSYMYQTVGHQALQYYADAMQLPLYRGKTLGKAINQTMSYTPAADDDDEVEDLHRLLLKIRSDIDFDAVSVGAIQSAYQSVRVKNVCQRLGVRMLAYMWQRDQVRLLDEMHAVGIDAVLIKVASLGLDERHVGKSLCAMHAHLLALNERYGCNPCGEGGEFETLTLDCPLFVKRLVLDSTRTIVSSGDVAHLHMESMHLEDKDAEERQRRLAACLQRLREFIGEATSA